MKIWKEQCNAYITEKAKKERNSVKEVRNRYFYSPSSGDYLINVFRYSQGCHIWFELCFILGQSSLTMEGAGFCQPQGRVCPWTSLCNVEHYFVEFINHNMFWTSMSHLVFKCHYIIESRPISRWSGDENPHLTDRRAIRFLVEQFQFQEESIPYGSKANIAQKLHHLCNSCSVCLCFRACFIIVVWCVIVCAYNSCKCVLGLNVRVHQRYQTLLNVHTESISHIWHWQWVKCPHISDGIHTNLRISQWKRGTLNLVRTE